MGKYRIYFILFFQPLIIHAVFYNHTSVSSAFFVILILTLLPCALAVPFLVFSLILRQKMNSALRKEAIPS